MMQLFSHMVQSASCTATAPEVIAALIVTLGALAGILLQEWLESRKQSLKKPKRGRN